MYILWSGRMGGWLTASGTYASQMKEAKTFGREAMLIMCRRHMNNGFAEFGLIPIAVADLEELRNGER